MRSSHKHIVQFWKIWDRIDSLNEGKVGNGGLSPDEPLLLGQDTLKNAPDTLDLVYVALLCAWDFLGMEECKPCGLPEVGTLA